LLHHIWTTQEAYMPCRAPSGKRWRL
jgi:hypothetical protein